MNKEEKRAYNKKYRESHKAETKAYGKEYREFHKGEIQAYNKKYQESHKEDLKAQARDYRESHKEERKAYMREYRESRPTIRFLGRQIPARYHDAPPEGYVWHHTCYDHANPEANLVLLSKSSHMMGHNLLRKLGIEILHINIGDDEL